MSSWKQNNFEMKYDKKELGKDVLQIYVPIVPSVIEKLKKRNHLIILKDIILWQRLWCIPQKYFKLINHKTHIRLMLFHNFYVYLLTYYYILNYNKSLILLLGLSDEGVMLFALFLKDKHLAKFSLEGCHGKLSC